MQVNFYNFSKKENSTAQPPSSALIASLDCYLKDGCTVVNPVIRVAWSANNMLPTYAYIATWGRYYFVTNTEYSGSALLFHLTVDVLATYKAQIGASTQYVARSASANNPYLQDSLYPTASFPNINKKTQATPFVGGGTYILGVIGRSSGTAGGAKGLVYYALTPAQMDTFTDWANNWTTAANMATNFATALSTTVDMFAGEMLHVFDYVKTAFWIPLVFTEITSGSAGAIVLGGYTAPSTVQAYKITTFNKIYAGSNNVCAFYLSGHPEEATRGAWVNSEPYTQRYLDIPYLGDVPVDCSMLMAGDAIIVQADISLIDGSAQFFILGEQDGEQFMISRHQSQIGVPIPINVVRSNIGGTVSSLAGGVVSALSGNFLGAVSGVANAVQNAIPLPQTMGSLSGFHVYHLNATFISRFWTIVGDDTTNHGRPLCARRKISSLSGYVQTEGAALALSATDGERAQVVQQMNEGFFYE